MSRIEEALAKAAGMMSGGRAVETMPHPMRPGAARVPMGEKRIGGVRLPEETLVVINDPLSPMAEEYRKLKEAVVKMTKRDRFDNLIVVTSATVAEGKSMTAVNLAACLALEYDHTVLLVDADLRRPTVHKYLQLGARKGLSDCLREGIDVGDLLVKTDIGKLTIKASLNGKPLDAYYSLFVKVVGGETPTRVTYGRTGQNGASLDLPLGSYEAEVTNDKDPARPKVKIDVIDIQVAATVEKIASF